jgi:hypothetical protein
VQNSIDYRLWVWVKSIVEVWPNFKRIIHTTNFNGTHNHIDEKES